MKLEDCTKEELIFCIRRRCILKADDIEFDVLIYRNEKAVNAEARHNDAASDCLQEYIDLLKPYEGRSMNEVPMDTIKAASAAMKRRELYTEKANREHKKYEQIRKLMDELLHL